MLASKSSSFFIVILLFFILIGHTVQAGLAQSKSTLALEKTQIDTSIVNEKDNLVRILNAKTLNLSTTVIIKPSKQTLRKGKAVKVEGSLTGEGILEVDLRRLAAPNLIPRGSYNITATGDKKKYKASFFVNPVSLVVGRLQVPATAVQGNTAGRTIRNQETSSKVLIRTLNFDTLDDTTSPIEAPLTLTKNDADEDVYEAEFITEKRDVPVVLNAQYEEAGKKYELNSLITDNTHSTKRADITPSTTIIANSTKSAETIVKTNEPDAEFSVEKYHDSVSEIGSIQSLDRTPTLASGFALGATVLAAESSEISQASKSAIENVEDPTNTALDVAVKTPSALSSNNLSALAEEDTLSSTPRSKHAIASLNSEEVPQDKKVDYLTKDHVIPGMYEELPTDELNDAVKEGAPPLFKVNKNLGENLNEVLQVTNINKVFQVTNINESVEIDIPKGALYDADKVQISNVPNVKVTAERGSIVTGTKDPGYKVFLEADALVDSRFASFATVVVEEETTTQNEDTEGIGPVVAGTDFVGLPITYDNDLGSGKIQVATKDKGIQDTNTFVIPTKGSSQQASLTSNRPVFNTETDNSFLQAGLTGSKESFTGGGAALLLGPLSGSSNTSESSQSTLSEIKGLLPTYSGNFAPSDRPPIGVAAVFNNIQGGTGGGNISSFIDNPTQSGGLLGSKPTGTSTGSSTGSGSGTTTGTSTFGDPIKTPGAI